MNTLRLATSIVWPVCAEHDRASARVPLSRFASLTFPSLTLTSRP
ncbi:MAG: hypothetical protein Q8J78_00325 [Moraxellaceae bacterium]|nr:hypothetical protein [Moraxellaceae bacterium]